MSTERKIELFDILDLINCADTYGHWNSVCQSSLWEWAKPVTLDDIERFSLDLASKDGYGEEDYEESKERLTAGYRRYIERTE